MAWGVRAVPNGRSKATYTFQTVAAVPEGWAHFTLCSNICVANESDGRSKEILQVGGAVLRCAAVRGTVMLLVV